MNVCVGRQTSADLAQGLATASCLLPLSLQEASSLQCVCLSVLQLQLSLNPRGSLCENNNVKETFGHGRSCILPWFMFPSLSSTPQIPNLLLVLFLFRTALPSSHSMFAHLIHSVDISVRFPASWRSYFSLLHTFSSMISLPAVQTLTPAVAPPNSSSLLRIFTCAVLPTFRTHYCQLCHLRPSEKKGEEGGGEW